MKERSFRYPMVYVYMLCAYDKDSEFVYRSADNTRWHKKGFKRALLSHGQNACDTREMEDPFGDLLWRLQLVAVTMLTLKNSTSQHFAKDSAWKVAEGAYEGLVQLRDAGVKLAVVSNFDCRLRPVLQDLQVYSQFDSIIVSSEIGYEKPAPQIFEAALKELKVNAEQAVHVGDDATADKARA